MIWIAFLGNIFVFLAVSKQWWQ